ncbi:MAG: radical SAM protein [Thermofilaceae archaeon]|nr:radical SAM protein [Thermofilaceae archaeon]
MESSLTEEHPLLKYSTIKDLSSDELEAVAKKYIQALMPKPNVDYKVYIGKAPELREGEGLVAYTLSLCPNCYSLVTAVLLRRENKVYERKVCPEHGEFEELYYGDYDTYERFKRWQEDGKGVWTPHVPITQFCPYNCGLCSRHKSHTALLNIAVTNRCSLRCWYCFFYAVKAGYVYEPSLNHIRFMLREARKVLPYPAVAVQITGGEPLLRDDIVDIVRIAKEEGYHHVQLNTEGIRLAFDHELAVKLREAGANVVYTSFDGVTPYTNPKNHWEIPYILESLRRARLGAVLVPTIIKGYNLHDIGAIIRFGIKHADIVRGVNMQPVSIVGRVPKKERDKLRITIPDVIFEIEKQTDGQIRREDWYPVPTVAPISRFVEALTGRPQFELTCHFACGAATYVFWDDTQEMIPITRFVDVEGVMEMLNKAAEDIRSGKNKYLSTLNILSRLGKYVDVSKAPKRFRSKRKFLRYIYNILVKHDYSALGEFHYQSLFLGLMHFMDLYNYDVSRVQRCEVHYVMPDGRVIPFCTFNVLPELYRDRAQKFFSYEIDEWEKLTGRRLSDEVYVRNVKKLIESDIYRKAYEGIIDVSSIPYEDHVLASKKFGIPVIE